MIRPLVAAFMILCLPMVAYADAAKDRANIQKMAKETLTQLYREAPHTKSEIKNAKGYAVFKSGGANVILFSAGSGKGFVHNNATGKDVYMKMKSVGVGIGLGVKDFRTIFVFSTADALEQFIDQGWDFSGQADAAAVAGEDGAEGSAAGTVMKGTNAYQITKNGLALQATLQGTKYYYSKSLNKYKK